MNLRSFQYRVSDEMLRGLTHVEAVASVLRDPDSLEQLELKLAMIDMEDELISQYVEEFRMVGWFD